MVSPSGGENGHAGALAQYIIPTSSPNDKREYRAITLPNGLRVLLIHDAQCVAAGACAADGAGAAAAGTSPAGNNVPAHGKQHPGEEGVHSDDEDEESLISGDEEEEEGSESMSEDGSQESGGGSEEDEHEHVKPGGRKQHHPAGPTKRAAAALSCGIGSYGDPWHAQGLSHFLEHMLFMGSETFPDENEYDSYLAANGGASNAFTEEENTTFHFDCKPDALRGALERFAGFFTCPLIKQDAMEREVNAVDNEFSGVLQSDSCRLMQLRCHTAKEGHLLHKFGWGNRKSLVDDPAAGGVDMRAELVSYYKQQYSAERMNLVILGGEPLDTLQAWAAELFASVPSGRGGRPSYAEAGFPLPGGRLYVVPAVREEHKLEATFQFPCLTSEYRKKAEDYISHLVGHESRGSLLSALKARGWATDLSAGVAESTSLASFFNVSITLTEAGLAAEPGCGLAVAGLLFEYFAMLRREGPQRWVWDEQAAMGAMRFRFQEEEEPADYVASIAGDLHHYPPRDVLAQPNLYEEWDPELIGKLLASMTPEAVRLDLQTHAFDACAAAAKAAMQAAAPGTEPWFDFPYVEAPLPPALMERWAGCEPSAELALPARNDYIPSDFSLRCEDNGSAGAVGKEAAAAGKQEQQPADGPAAAAAAAAAGAAEDAFPSPPSLLLEEPGLRLFHKMDTTFKVPRTNAYFRLASPACYDSPRAAALTHLLVKLLEDALCETAYAADVAGLHYGIWFEGRAGLDFKIDGFSHKLPLLVRFIFTTLAKLGPALTSDSFARVKEALVRVYRNTNMKPIKHVTYLRLYALKDSLWHPDVVLQPLEAATLEDVRAFLPTLLADLHIEALLHGNVTRQEAAELARSIHATLGSSKLAADARPTERCVQLPKGPAPLLHRAPVKNAEEDNSCVEAYFQTCADTVADRAAIDLLDQMVYEPCFDQLRTREQLGYTVSSGMRLTHGVLGFAVVVMSGEHGPAHLDSRIEAFLESFGETLASIEQEKFEENRAALISAKLQRDAHMVHESDRAWEAIASRRYDFNVRRDEVAHLRAIDLSQVRAFYDRHLRPSSPARRKLAVHVVGRGHGGELGEQGGGGGSAAGRQQASVVLPDLDQFRQAATFYAPVSGSPPPLAATE